MLMLIARIVGLIGLVLLLTAQADAQSRVRGQGEMCGGIAGFQCRDGLWCDPRPGLCRGRDVSGVCIRVPEVCTREYRPVCGCDGRTYGNDCERRAAKVAKDHDGACRARRPGRPR